MNSNQSAQIINRIKERRLALNLSYQDLSNRTGISKSTLQRYESGYIGSIALDKLQILADGLHVSPQFIMGWPENDSVASTISSGDSLSSSESRLIKKYRQLDPKGQAAVDRTLEGELALANQQEADLLSQDLA